MKPTKPLPKQLKTRSARQTARRMRDEQWRFMERCQTHHPLWWCIWNKIGRPELADEWRSGLIDGMELLNWIEDHRGWFRIGRWNAERYARPVSLKPAGREALQHRERYDMEPVKGGLVEPGFECIPWPRQRKRP